MTATEIVIVIAGTVVGWSLLNLGAGVDDLGEQP
jgi:hypothetical protein